MIMAECSKCGNLKLHALGLCEKCYHKDWRIRNPLKISAKNRRYRTDHPRPEDWNRQMAEWRKKNPERFRYNAARSAWRHLTPVQRKKLLKEIPVDYE
jgi:hypothetical protein